MLSVVLPVFNLVFPQYLRLSNLNLWQMDKQQMAVRKKKKPTTRSSKSLALLVDFQS